MIYTCPVKGCGALHEMGSDHLNEPCVSCWQRGWRSDCFGNTYRVPVVVVDLDREDPLSPARGIVFGTALALLFFWIPLLLVAIWRTA